MASVQLAGTFDLAPLKVAATRALTVELRDEDGNLNAGDNTTVVTFAQTNGTGAVTGLGTATAVAGVASLTVTGSTAGDVEVTASAANLISSVGTLSVYADDTAPVEVGYTPHVWVESEAKSPRSARMNLLEQALAGATTTADAALAQLATPAGAPGGALPSGAPADPTQRPAMRWTPDATGTGGSWGPALLDESSFAAGQIYSTGKIAGRSPFDSTSMVLWTRDGADPTWTNALYPPSDAAAAYDGKSALVMHNGVANLVARPALTIMDDSGSGGVQALFTVGLIQFNSPTELWGSQTFVGSNAYSGSGNSGNGLMAFQSGTTPAAAGMTFGTDLALYRSATKTMTLDADGALGSATVNLMGLTQEWIKDSANNTIVVPLAVRHSSTVGAAASFGARLQFSLDSSANTNRAAGAIDSVWTTATDAAEYAYLRFLTMSNGTLTEAGRFVIGADTFPSLLVGTTTKTGALSMHSGTQIADGGIAFGTDAGIYRTGTRALSIDNGGGQGSSALALTLWGNQTIQQNDSTTNSELGVLTLAHTVSGVTPVATFGVNLTFALTNGGTVSSLANAARISANWSDPGSGISPAPTGYLRVLTSNAGTLGESARFTGGNHLLLGTTTDTGTFSLPSAGTITFSTDTYMRRIGAGIVEIDTDGAGGGPAELRLGGAAADAGAAIRTNSDFIRVLTGAGVATTGIKVGWLAISSTFSTANQPTTANGIRLITTNALEWGASGAASDARLYRSAATTLKIDSDGAGTAVDLLVAGKLTSFGPTQGIGYSTGAGGTVTQATSKATGVTLNKVCGQVTMNNAALAASTSVSFTLTNSAIAATDVVNVSIGSGATANSYLVFVDQVSAGSCRVHVRNISAGSLSEALVLNFAVQKAVTS